MSEEQQAIVADGVITFGEYEAAIFATVRCLKTAGFGVTDWPSPDRREPAEGPVLSRRGRYQYLADTHGQEGQAVAEAIESCRTTHSDIVERLWADHVAPSQQEVQYARDLIASCLREEGVAAPTHPTGEELMRLAFPPDGVATGPPREPYRSCAERAARETDIPRYLGQ
jgi:hypothetical protein